MPKLEAIDWSSLEHAYGAAADLPRHLRSLRSTDAGTREAALDALYDSLWRRGTLYPATPFAIPYLLDLVGEGVGDRALLMLFLADLGRSAPLGDDPWYAETLAALHSGVPILASCLSSEDEVDRITASVALAWADEGAVLSSLLGGELPTEDDGERLVALYALAAGRAPPPVALLERYAADGPATSRLVARLGLARAGRPASEVDPAAYSALAEIVGTVAPQALPQPVELLDPATAPPAAIRALAGVLERTKHPRTAVPLVEFLLAAVFPDGYEEPPSPLQLEVLRAVAGGSAAWIYPGDTLAALAEQGIDVIDRADLCVRLGLDPLDGPDRPDTEALLVTSEATAVRYAELSEDECDLLEQFVDLLDAAGWNDTRNWHRFVTGGPTLAISPLGVGRHYNEEVVFECTLWLFDEHVAADTGERTGSPYVRLLVADKAEQRDPIGFRAYAGDTDTLDGVIRVIDRHRPTLDRDDFSVFLHELFEVTSKVEVELANGRVLEIQPRRTDEPT